MAHACYFRVVTRTGPAKALTWHRGAFSVCAADEHQPLDRYLTAARAEGSLSFATADLRCYASDRSAFKAAPPSDPVGPALAIYDVPTCNFILIVYEPRLLFI